MQCLVNVASDMISFRFRELAAIRSPEQTQALVEACRSSPTPRNLAKLAWDFIEDVLAVALPEHRLPPAADRESLERLRSATRHSNCELPEELLELLACHDGIRRTEPSTELVPCTALYSSSEMMEMLAFDDVDNRLLPISGDLAGNHAVVRLTAGLPDDGTVYAFWHEDFPEDGLEPLARNAAEYLMLAHAHIVETISDMYRGPSSLV